MARSTYPALFALLPLACTAVSSDAELRAATDALVRAEPSDWPERADAVLACGSAAAPILAAAIRTNRGAPGEQCAIAVLGELGAAESAVPLLLEILREGGQSGTEAALALGRLHAHDAMPALVSAAGDATLDPATRTASAGALLDLGDEGIGVDLLAAILVAGTPFGRDSSARFELPDKTRWALERTLAIDAIARRFGGERFGLDADASWPDLEHGRTLFVARARGASR